jgi:P-type Cu+ transporter
VLALAGAVEHASAHPVARAVTAYARRHVDTLPDVDGFAAVDGLGVCGTVAGRDVVVGRALLLAREDIPLPDELAQALAAHCPRTRSRSCASCRTRAGSSRSSATV